MLEVIYYNDDRYVWSKSLHKALGLSEINYSQNVKSWISDKRLFHNNKEYKAPVENYDFIDEKAYNQNSKGSSINSIGSLISSNLSIPQHPKSLGNSSENYLIRLELAKIITVNSEGALKDRLVQWLLKVESDLENNQILSKKSILGLMEMVKMCSYIDAQLKYYKQHKDRFFEGKDEQDSWKEFDNFRNGILKIMSDAEINEKYLEIKKEKPKSIYTKIEKYAILDSLESIRNSLFDFLAQQFNPYGHTNLLKARDLSDFVKQMFESAGIKEFDIKPKNYNPHGQINMFRPIDEIVNVPLISQTIRELGNFSNA